MRNGKRPCWLFSAVTVLVVLAFVAGCAGNAQQPEASAKPIEWTWVVTHLEGSYFSSMTEVDLPKRVEEATKGRLKINVRQNLVPITEAVDAVLDRRVDGATQTWVVRADYPLANWAALPSLGRDDVTALWPKVKSVVVGEIEGKGLVYGAMGAWGSQIIFARKPLNTIEDLKGFKVRTHNKMVATLMDSASASPQAIDPTEVYNALQTGVLDGAISSHISILGFGWAEVVKFSNVWPIGQGMWGMVINKAAWDGLPADLKPVVRKVFDDMEPEMMASGKRQDERDEPLVKQKGVTIVQPNKAEAEKMATKAGPIVQAWMDSTGPKAKEIVDAIKQAQAR